MGEYLPEQRRPVRAGRHYRPAVYWHCFAWRWSTQRADWSFPAAWCCYPVSWSPTGLKRLSTTMGEYLPDQRGPVKTGRHYRPAVYWNCFAWHWLKKRADWSFPAARYYSSESRSRRWLAPSSTTLNQYLPSQSDLVKAVKHYRPELLRHCFACCWSMQRACWPLTTA